MKKLNYIKSILMVAAICVAIQNQSYSQIGVDSESGVKVGNSTDMDAGNIRFDGTEFQGYDGLSWKSLSTPWTKTGSDIYFMGGNVGIGLMDPSEPLQIGGTTEIFMNSTSGVPHLRLIEDQLSSGASTRIAFQSSNNAINEFEIRSFLSGTSDHKIGWSYDNIMQVVWNQTDDGLGIGTQDPAGKLHVQSSSTSSHPHVQLREQTDNSFTRLFFDNASNLADRWALSSNTGTTNDHLIGFYYNGENRMIYNETTGGLGLGTAIPDQLLHLNFSGSNGIKIIGDGTGDARIWIANTGGGNFLFDDADDENTFKVQTANDLAFLTGGVNERMRISDNGHVAINTDPNVNWRLLVNNETSLYGFGCSTDTPGTSYSIRGTNNSTGAQTKYGTYGSVVGTAGTGNSYGVYGFASTTPTNFYAVYSAGDCYVSGTFTNPSDRRLKKNIVNLDSVLDRVLALETKTYEFDHEKYPHANFATGQQIGFIAQNVQELFPTVVEEQRHVYETGDPDAEGNVPEQELNLLAIKNLEMIPILTKAIQEQQEIINQQQAQIEALLQQNQEILDKLKD